MCFIAVDWARLFPEQSIQPFRIGITVMGSVVHFLSALIMSSSFYFVDSVSRCPLC